MDVSIFNEAQPNILAMLATMENLAAEAARSVFREVSCGSHDFHSTGSDVRDVEHHEAEVSKSKCESSNAKVDSAMDVELEASSEGTVSVNQSVDCVIEATESEKNEQPAKPNECDESSSCSDCVWNERITAVNDAARPPCDNTEASKGAGRESNDFETAPCDVEPDSCDVVVIDEDCTAQPSPVESVGSSRTTAHSESMELHTTSSSVAVSPAGCENAPMVVKLKDWEPKTSNESYLDCAKLASTSVMTFTPLSSDDEGKLEAKRKKDFHLKQCGVIVERLPVDWMTSANITNRLARNPSKRRSFAAADGVSSTSKSKKSKRAVDVGKEAEMQCSGDDEQDGEASTAFVKTNVLPADSPSKFQVHGKLSALASIDLVAESSPHKPDGVCKVTITLAGDESTVLDVEMLPVPLVEPTLPVSLSTAAVTKGVESVDFPCDLHLAASVHGVTESKSDEIGKTSVTKSLSLSTVNISSSPSTPVDVETMPVPTVVPTVPLSLSTASVTKDPVSANLPSGLHSVPPAPEVADTNPHKSVAARNITEALSLPAVNLSGNQVTLPVPIIVPPYLGNFPIVPVQAGQIPAAGSLQHEVTGLNPNETVAGAKSVPLPTINVANSSTGVLHVINSLVPMPVVIPLVPGNFSPLSVPSYNSVIVSSLPISPSTMPAVRISKKQLQKGSPHLSNSCSQPNSPATTQPRGAASATSGGTRADAAKKEVLPVAKLLANIGLNLACEMMCKRALQQKRKTEPDEASTSELEMAIGRLASKNAPFTQDMHDRHKCRRCSFVATTRNGLQHHLATGRVNPNARRTLHGWMAEYSCCQCDSFSTGVLPQFVSHIRSVHGMQARVEEYRLLDRIPCPNCYYEGRVQSGVSYHVNKCNKTFNTDVNLAPSRFHSDIPLWATKPKQPPPRPQSMSPHVATSTNSATFGPAAAAASLPNQIARLRGAAPTPPHGSPYSVSVSAAAAAAAVFANKVGPAVNPVFTRPPSTASKPASVTKKSIRRLPPLGQMQHHGRFPTPTTSFIRTTMQPAAEIFRMMNNSNIRPPINNNSAVVVNSGPEVSSLSAVGTSGDNNRSVVTIVLPSSSSSSSDADAGAKPTATTACASRTCELCDRSFGLADTKFIMHINLEHGINMTKDDLLVPIELRRAYCSFCPAKFFTAAGLNRHVRKAHPKKLVTYRCRCCKMERIVDIVQHLMNDHHLTIVDLWERTYCHVCGVSLCSAEKHWKHAVEFHGDLLSSCGYLLPQPPGTADGNAALAVDGSYGNGGSAAIGSRISIVKPPASNAATTNVPAAADLNPNVKAVERRQPAFQCAQCGQRFWSVEMLASHEKMPHLFRCIRCSLTFPSRLLSQRHANTVHRLVTEPCQICSELVQTGQTMMLHLKALHLKDCSVVIPRLKNLHE